MTNALSLAYPPYRSPAARLLLPLVAPRSYLRAVHLLLMFPLGLAYFVFFVVSFAFGGSLIWTFIGPPVLLLALFVSLYIGDLEAWLVNLTTGEGIHRPPKVMEGVTSLRERVWTRVIDPSTWTGVLYQVAQFPIGLAGFLAVVVGFSVTGALLGSPLIVWLAGEAPIADDLGLDRPLEAVLLVPVGVIAWFITVHVITLCSALHALWSRLMLRSRARHHRPTTEGGPPEPGPGTPLAAAAVEAQPPVAGALPATLPDGNTPGSPALLEAPNDDPALAELTAREWEVLLLVARGYSNADIGEACYISEGTVKTHVRHILAKLDMLDRTQLIIFAYEHGIVTPSRRPGVSALAC